MYREQDRTALLSDKIVRDIDKELRKDFIIRGMSVLIFTLTFVLFSVYIFREFFSEPPSINFVKGNVKIFVNGIWIPLRAGISYDMIKTARLKIDKGEVWIGESIKLSSEGYTEVEIHREKIKVVKGELKVQSGESEVKLKENQELKLSIAVQKEEEHLKSGVGEGEVVEKLSISDVGEDREKKKDEFQRRDFPPRISEFTIDVRGLNAYVFVRTSATKLFINGIPAFSDTGTFYVVLPLVEGENEIVLQVENEEGELLTLDKKEVAVDYTPPVLEDTTIEWGFE